MTIRQKLLSCLGLFAVITLLLVGAFWTSASTSRTALHTVLHDRVVPLRDLKLVADNYAVRIVDAAQKAESGSISIAQAASDIREGQGNIDAAWQRYRATRIEGREQQLALEAQARMQNADAAVKRLQAIMATGDRAAFDRFVANDLYTAIDPVSDALAKLVDLQIEIASEHTTEAESNAALALTVMAILAAIAAAILAFSYFTITRRVIDPIKALATLIRERAQASGEQHLPDLDRKDEIGDISRSVDAFLAAAVEKERRNAAVAAKEQATVVDALDTSLAAMQAGDLTATITVDFPPAYAKLKTNFNATLTALRDLIGSVVTGAAALRSGTSEIAQAAEDLARRTESNAASLEETSAAIAQMEERLRTTAGAATTTLTRADGAISTVSDGRKVADEAVQAMARVAEGARGIDDVIEGLDKVAFQTRVLAMNAAVEAGRAGEAGRGFAVVADLVSALAMRAEAEAARAREQLTTTQADISSAVAMVERVDGALSNISGDVGEVHGLLGQIATDNQAQSSAITEISSAVSAMDQSTQQNAAMVEQTSAAARNLAAEVEMLSANASTFHVGDGSTPRAPKPSRSAPMPAAQPTLATSFRPQQSAAANNAHPAAKVIHDAAKRGSAGSNDWTEF
ncbi:methyl-accepting chemotaxis protein [Stakelama pacifica]|uniref:Methyl-accepting chemotaxis sensory transducer with TarH sensor n=1 Tax=Stakelama pacifica TaxID=517720 RepID=A0A4R6FMT9_9SPHN|nr:methyl-accepting chemotaxis protein [Stakelama pacifica]TDN82906.1 methyl-accepting chemotaxis sensory transducer with TarH sensor [Stakelama pacifica]GGO95239.1 hypothetical protein GCM10011329_18960 [Stakelama pacifica]